MIPEPPAALRGGLDRDGIFNLRDLGGTPGVDGTVVRGGLLVRADALQRCSPGTVASLHDHGIRRVLDLRDDSERVEDGTFTPVAGLDIEVVHVPMLDPTYRWEVTDIPRSELLAHRYQDILTDFGDRLADAFRYVVEADGGVAYHCAVGKDRTGLLTLLLLGALGSPRSVIVADYVVSAQVTSRQVAWFRDHGHRYADVDTDDIATGVWSARPETIVATINHLDAVYGGIDGYISGIGIGADAVAELRGRLLRSGG